MKRYNDKKIDNQLMAVILALLPSSVLRYLTATKLLREHFMSQTISWDKVGLEQHVITSRICVYLSL